MLSLDKLVGNGFVCMKVWKVTLIDRNPLGTQVFWVYGWIITNKFDFIGIIPLHVALLHTSHQLPPIRAQDTASVYLWTEWILCHCVIDDHRNHTLFTFPFYRKNKMQFWSSKIEKVRFIKFDISPIKIVAFWKKLFEMPCQFSFIFQYIVNSKPTIFIFPL